MKMYRQGDILIVEELYRGNLSDPQITARQDKIVAYGEATGHKHEFVGDVKLFDGWGKTYAQVKQSTHR